MLTGLLVFVIAVTAILAVPVTVLFRLSWPNRGGNDIRLRWAFGLVRARLPAEPSQSHRARRDRKRTETKRPFRAPRGKTNPLAAIRQPRFRRRVMRFAGDVWAAIHKRDVQLRMRIGLGDPADTGQFWAIVGPVAGVLASVRSLALRVDPDFQDEGLELSGRGRIRIVPLKLLCLVAALGLSPSFWRGMRAMRASPG